MAQHDPAHDPRRWSGPIERLGEDERRSLVAFMTPEARPRVEIDDALHNGWFEMWYQPKIDLKRKCLAGAEALPASRSRGANARQFSFGGHRGQHLPSDRVDADCSAARTLSVGRRRGGVAAEGVADADP